MVATLTPATCNCEAETKPEPCISSKKLVPGAVWVTEPEVKSGSGLSTLTLREAEDADVDSVVALIVIEWPAQIVDAGEYRPAADIGPVELVAPAKPFTDHTTGVVTPPAVALYCAVPPSLTADGPLRETDLVTGTVSPSRQSSLRDWSCQERTPSTAYWAILSRPGKPGLIPMHGDDLFVLSKPVRTGRWEKANLEKCGPRCIRLKML